MEPYWSDGESVTLYLGDCLDVLRALPADSVDAIVTDPPAGIAFMDREWDDFRRARNPADAGRDNVFGRTSARGPEYGRRDRGQFVDMLTARLAEAYRVLKPGGHALVWSIPRTSHWTAWAVEDAGFDLRDCVMHLFGSGFPKSLDVARAIDKVGGVSPEVQGAVLRAARERAGLTRAEVAARVGCKEASIQNWEDGRARAAGRAVEYITPSPQYRDALADLLGYTADERRLAGASADRRGDGSVIGLGHSGALYADDAATDSAKLWDGWGTALKPGQEMWWLARKPLRGTVAANVLEFGTGALNIDACKVAHASEADRAESEGKNRHADFGSGPRDNHIFGSDERPRADQGNYDGSAGRWPANIVLTHSAACNGACAADCPVAELDRQSGVTSEKSRVLNRNGARQMDGWGLAAQSQGIVHGDTGGASRFYPVFRYQAKAPASERPRLDDGTAHETVKPLGLISWLVRLITPPGGTVLDMFAGSGPVAEACIVEGFRCVLVEQDAKSAALIRKRLSKPIQPVMFGLG